MDVKKFRSRNDEVVRIASLSGHIMLIGSEWVTIADPTLQSMAYAQGCISDDMLVSKATETAKEAGVLDNLVIKEDTKEEIRKTIQGFIDKNTLDAFTTKGRPKVAYMREAMGKSVPNHLLDEVWHEMADMIPVGMPSGEELKNDIT
jgi:hypothetical protein